MNTDGKADAVWTTASAWHRCAQRMSSRAQGRFNLCCVPDARGAGSRSPYWSGDARQIAEAEAGRSFRRRLTCLRREAHLTQEALSARAGLSRNYIGLLEIGRRRPSLATTLQIRRALGVKLEELIGEENPMLKTGKAPAPFRSQAMASRETVRPQDRLIHRLASCSPEEIDAIAKVVRIILKLHRA